MKDITVLNQKGRKVLCVDEDRHPLTDKQAGAMGMALLITERWRGNGILIRKSTKHKGTHIEQRLNYYQHPTNGPVIVFSVSSCGRAGRLDTQTSQNMRLSNGLFYSRLGTRTVEFDALELALTQLINPRKKRKKRKA